MRLTLFWIHPCDKGKQDFYFLDYTSMDDPCALLDRYFEEELELVRDWDDLTLWRI